MCVSLLGKHSSTRFTLTLTLALILLHFHLQSQGTLSGEFLVGDHSRFILSITESATTPRRFGVCFADVGTAEISLCGFDDDPALTHLETLLVQVNKQTNKQTNKQQCPESSAFGQSGGCAFELSS
jgi:hypothetical protein